MQDYLISSYLGVGALRFDMSRAQVHAQFGSPLRTKNSRFFNELTEFRAWGGLHLTFSGADDKLVEIGLYPNLPNVEFRGLSLFQGSGSDILKVLVAMDDHAFETVGVTIFPRLGLSVTGFLHRDDADKSVTVFARGRFDEEIAKRE